MEEKRNIRLFVLLLVLLAITTVAYLFVHRAADTFIDKSMFRIASDKTDRVLIMSSKDTITLQVENNKWKVNDVYDADLNMIEVLFATIDQIEPKREVSVVQKDSVSNVLKQHGASVQFFEGNNLQLEFQSGGNARKTEAWYQRANDATPYVMVIPGYRVYGSGIFELDANGWRNKRVFNFNWRNFKTLSTIVTKEPAQGFTITTKGNTFGVDGIVEADTAKVNNYLDAVSLLVGDQFISQTASKSYDSLSKTPSSFTIQVTDIASRVYSLDLYPPLKNDQNILGKLDDKDWILINREKIIPLARKKDYFKAN